MLSKVPVTIIIISSTLATWYTCLTLILIGGSSTVNSFDVIKNTSNNDYSMSFLPTTISVSLPPPIIRKVSLVLRFNVILEISTSIVLYKLLSYTESYLILTKSL